MLSDSGIAACLCKAGGLQLNITINLTLYWNTQQLGKAVMQRKRAGLKTPKNLLKHISPLGWEHILLIGRNYSGSQSWLFSDVKS